MNTPDHHIIAMDRLDTPISHHGENFAGPKQGPVRETLNNIHVEGLSHYEHYSLFLCTAWQISWVHCHR